MPFPRMTTRRLMVGAVAVGCAAAVVPLWEKRSSRLASARQYRWYEMLARDFGRRFESCAAKHGRAGRRSATCPTCGIWWGHLRTFDGRQVGTVEEAVAVHRRSIELFARWARRYERGALMPWLNLPPVSSADRDTWTILRGENCPLGAKFFTIL